MGVERHVGDLLSACRIDHGKPAFAVADDDAIAPRINADVVGIGAERDGPEQREGGRLVKAQRSVSGVGDIERRRARMIGNALRLAEPGDPVQDLALLQVDDAHAVVAEFGHEQKLPIGVESKVIDAARHGAERDLCLEHQGRRVLGPTRRRKEQADQGRQHRHALHCRLPVIGPAIDGIYCGPATYFLASTLSSAARSPVASLRASSLAQKCMKKTRGCSSSMWLCRAVISMPLACSALITGLTSLASSTKSPVMAAVSKPVGWKLMAIAAPIGPGKAMPWSVIGWARGMPNW